MDPAESRHDVKALILKPLDDIIIGFHLAFDETGRKKRQTDPGSFSVVPFSGFVPLDERIEILKHPICFGVIDTPSRECIYRAIGYGRFYLLLDNPVNEVANIVDRQIAEVFVNIRIKDETLFQQSFIVPGFANGVDPLFPEVRVLYQIVA